jgi:hypothetical protein
MIGTQVEEFQIWNGDYGFDGLGRMNSSGGVEVSVTRVGRNMQILHPFRI